jgi:hypothetical protein
MRNLTVTIYHPAMSTLSDRTFRELLKEVSRRLNRIHKQEANYLIDSFQIADPQRQSLRDRIEGELPTIANYYIDKVERSSLTLILMFTGLAYYVLQNTIGKSVEEAWKQSEAHRQIVEYLSTDLRERRVKELINQQFPEGGRITRFRIVDVSFKKKPQRDLDANIQIDTPQEIETTRGPAIDAAYVIKHGESILKTLPTSPPRSKKS